MKKNSVIILLIVIIFGLLSYILYDKSNKNKTEIPKEKNIEVVDSLLLSYVNIYLTNDGNSYIVPLNKDEINNLNIGDNLKDRLNTLYERAFYYDVYADSFKLKGFQIKLDSKIKKIYKLNLNNFEYVVFLKENNTIGLFSEQKYCDDLYTDVIDNYNNLKNVSEIKNNKIIYLDGSKEIFKLKD